MSLLSNQLLETIKQSTEQPEAGVRLATVSSVSGSYVYVKFYGDSTASRKSYKRLSSYSPSTGDTVLMINVNGSYVIAGRVE